MFAFKESNCIPKHGLLISPRVRHESSVTDSMDVRNESSWFEQLPGKRDANFGVARRDVFIT